MAKAKSGVNKSEAIREAMKNNPKAAPAEIVEILKGKGVEVAVGLVYQVKQQSGKKKKNGKKNRDNQAKGKASSNGKVGFGAAIATVRKAASAVGGIDNLLEIATALKD